MTTPVAALALALRAEEEGALGQARALAQRALAGFEATRDPDPAGAAAALQLLGGIALREGHPAQAIEALRLALGLREATRDLDEQASILGDLVSAHLMDGDPASAIERARQALRVRQAQGRPSDVLAATHLLCHLLVDARDLDGAEGPLAAALAIAGEDAPRARAALELLRVRVALARDDTDTALAVGLQALRHATAARFPPVVADAEHQLARVHVARMDLEPAELLLQSAAATRAAAGDRDGHVAALRDLAAVQTSRGKPRSAATTLRAAVDGLGADDPTRIDALLALASVHEHGGDPEGAARAAREAVEAARASNPRALAPALRAQAERAVGAGDLDLAAKSLEEAAVAAEDPVARATARAMLGELLAAMGHTARAIAQLVEARAAFEGRDAGAAAQITETLEGLGHASR